MNKWLIILLSILGVIAMFAGVIWSIVGAAYEITPIDDGELRGSYGWDNSELVRCTPEEVEALGRLMAERLCILPHWTTL